MLDHYSHSGFASEYRMSIEGIASMDLMYMHSRVMRA